jgi:LmbE family N-acetylglucosaminyl deacetylase
MRLSHLPSWSDGFMPRSISQGPVLIVAHPDDETLGAGDLIAHLRSSGSEVIVAAVADGVQFFLGLSYRAAYFTEGLSSAFRSPSAY